jgi:hypothetical protein
LLRALQVARIDRIEARALFRFARKPHSEPLRLCDAGRRERDVDMPLYALDAIPVRFAVPDEENLSGHENKRCVFVASSSRISNAK